MPDPITPSPTGQPPMRRFGDTDAVRTGVFDNALAAAASLPPAENSRYRLSITEPGWAGSDKVSLADHKNAILSGRSLARRLTGNLTLTDKASGTVVDARRLTLASVPVITRQGTFIIDGSAYPLSSQQRLLPGLYTRKTQAGMTELHVNLMPGAGVPHRIQLDPETGVFNVHVGQANIPLLPLARAFGLTDDELKGAWGPELFRRNEKAAKPHHIDKLWEKFGPPGPVPDGVDKAAVIAERMGKYPIDPWVSRRTLGKPYRLYGKEPLLTATKKILAVARNETEPDDRDNPVFSTVWGPEHLIAERIARSGPLLSKALWQATNVGHLRRLQPGFLSGPVRALFMKSGLAGAVEGSSAAEFMDHGSRITKIGEGGIGRNSSAVPFSARNVSVGQFPFIDPVRTSESENVGLDLRLAFGTRLGSDKRIYAPLFDTKAKRIVYRSPQDLADATLAFPGGMGSQDPLVPVIQGGKMTHAPREEVDYVVPSMEQTFSPMTNLVPFKSASKPHRASMGSRFVTQSLPLVNPEAPLVRSQVPGQPGKSFEELFGRHMGAVFADTNKPGGVVTAVDRDRIAVRHDDGTVSEHELYADHPAGRKVGLNNFPLVKQGDRIAPGQLLARSNFTDDKGHAAYGANLRVAFMNFKNLPYEDAIVLSRSAADRLTSDHLYKYQVTPDDNTTIDKAAHVSAFPGKHTLDILKNVGSDGVVKPGTKVGYGDPLILAVRKKPTLFGRLSRSGRVGFSDASETWDYHEPGEVTDVVHGPYGPAVVVKTVKPSNEGDKVSNRHGGKGVIRIVPDDQMPVAADGKPVEMVQSSLSIVSRANPSQLYESLLGKIAARTGKPYVVNDWDDTGDGKNLRQFVQDEANKHNTHLLETVTDPETGKEIPNVAVGNMYVMKLLHIAEAKAKGRGLGGYDESGQPVRGQDDGAMRASLGDTNALLSHGATDVLKDIHIFKGQDNPEFWLQFMTGYPPTKPHISQPFERFLSELRAAGIDPVERSGRYHLMALTNKRVQELAGNREVKNGETLDFSRNGNPYPGGLFDTTIFGSPDARSTWGKITLHEPMLNPAMEDATRRLLGLTEKQFRDVIAGKHELPTGTGPQAIASALADYDVPGETSKVRKVIATGRKTARDEAIRKLFYLKGLEKTKQHPRDWVLSAVPVLPPAFRPVTAGNRGNIITADANLLYSDLINANSVLKDLSGRTADVGAERLNLYDAVKGVVGMGEPVGAKNRERGVKGVLGRLLGDSSKMSFLQTRLLGTPVNLSGRGTIIPDPDLDMDQIGIPESIAWDIYKPFIVRRLVRSGVGRAEAVRQVADQSKMAKDALLSEMDARPVRATRYPVLHRYSSMAFKPKLVTGDAIRTNHIIVKGYNADFDGDQQLNTVVISLTSEDLAGNIHGVPQSFWETRDMTARFRTSVPGFDLENQRYFSVHLQDFPHGEKIGEKDGAAGRIEFYQVDPRIKVIAYDEKEGRPVLASVAGWSKHIDREVEIVTLGSGRQIVTDDDDRAVYGIDPATMTFHRARPSQATGLMVPRVDRFLWDGGQTEIVFRDIPDEPLHLKLTEQTGYILGALAGNGWSSSTHGESKQVLLACTDPGVEAEFRSSFSIAFDVDLYINTQIVRTDTDASSFNTGFGRSARLSICNKFLARQVAKLIGCGARSKHLPPFFLAGDEAFRRGLFRGLMDTDGSISNITGKGKPQLLVSYTSASLRLIQEIQHLARSLGVMASITETKTPLGEPFWLLGFSSPDFQRLGLKICHTEKAAKLASAGQASTEAGPYTRNHMVPLPGRLVPALRKHIKNSEHRSLYSTLSQILNTNRLTRQTAEKLLALLPHGFGADDPMWQMFKRIVADTSTVWDTVTGFRKTGIKETGYDLTVPGYETFMSVDGVILSNTMTVDVPLSDEAVKEAYQKLLPSKNLYSTSDFTASAYLPGTEGQQGLHYASTADAGNPPVEFKTRTDAVKAYLEHKLPLAARVRILEED